MRVPTVIKTLGDPFSGLSGKTKEDFGHGDASYITFLNVLSNPTINPAAFEKVDVLPNEKQNLCKKGDLFFNTSSETPEEVGMCSCLNVDCPRLYLNSFCFGFRLKDPDSADSQFLAYYFRGKEGRQLMTMLAQGSTRYNLSKEYFLDSTIEIPLVDEQRQIVEALTSIDKLINNLSRTIAKKENMRDGAMEELLSGKRRLPGFSKPWEDKRISEIFDIKKGRGLSKDVLTKNGDNPCILYGEIFTTYVYFVGKCVSHTNCKDGYLSCAGDVLLPGSTTTNGLDLVKAVCVFDDDILLGGDIIILRNKKKKVDSLFMAYFLSTINRQNIAEVTQGTTIIHLHAKDVRDVVLCIPSDKKEQEAISDIITAMDDEIQVMKIEKEKYEQIRSGMMDDLLSGKIRLK